MNWTAEEARYALSQLILRRKIRPFDVERALAERRREIHSLRERLADLESLGSAGRSRSTASVKRRGTKRPRRKLSARARSQLRLQGRYMGYVRRLTSAQKAQVRKVRSEKGWRAAIAAARKLAKG